MKKILVAGFALLPVLCSTGVYAAEGMSGTVSVGGISNDVSGNKAKFSEYGDPDSGVTGGLEMRSNVESGFVNFTAADIARDIQNFTFDTGQYGKFKVDAYYKEIPHNLTFDAKSYYSGVGSDTLTTTATSTSLPNTPDTWPSVFDYSVTRDQYGAGLKLDMLKPLFANFSVSKNDQSGIKPTATYIGISAELPEPVDYETNTIRGEIGYGEDPIFVSMSYLLSSFDNTSQYLDFSSLAAANRSEFLGLPPDNTYSKFAIKGRVKMPMHSSLAANFSQAKAESTMDLAPAYNSNGTAFVHNLSDTVFDGKVNTINYNIVLTSSPASFLDGKLFFSGYEKDNDSDKITSSRTTTTTTTPFDNHLFGYEKTSYGIETGFKIPGHVKLTPYYKNVDVERHRGDFPETADDIYGINAKWTGLDYLALKMVYERMDRDSDWHQLTLATGDQNASNAIEPYVRRFDAATQNRDTFKLGMDITPCDYVNLGLGYAYKTSDYTDTVFGLLEKDSNGVNFSADVTVNDTISISGYVDYEVTNSDQTQRNLGTSVTAVTASPDDTTVGDGRYNWTANQEEKTLDYGIGLNAIVIPKILTLRTQFDHIRSDGFADYTYFESVPTGYTNDSVDSGNWDDYTKNSLMVKAIYEATQNVTLTGGYVYEDYEYNDQFSDGYSYVWSSSATANNYLTGAGMDPNYTANVFFLNAKYKF